MRRELLKLISGEFARLQYAGGTSPSTPSRSLSLCLLSIFDDVGDYILSSSSSSKPAKDKDRHRERDRDRDREDDGKSRRHTYFEKPRGEEHQVSVLFSRYYGHKVVNNNLGFFFFSLSVSLCRWWRLIQVSHFSVRLSPQRLANNQMTVTVLQDQPQSESRLRWSTRSLREQQELSGRTVNHILQS